METQKNLDIAREEVWTKHNELCHAIGAYIICFENLIATIKVAIHEILKKNGQDDQNITNAIIADLTAGPLFKMFDSMLCVTLPDEYNDATFKKRYKETYQGILDAIEYRNKIAHTHWHISLKYIPYTNEASTKLSANLLRNKKGKGAENYFQNSDYSIIDELKTQTAKTYYLGDLVHEIIINVREKMHLNRVWMEEFIG